MNPRSLVVPVVALALLAACSDDKTSSSSATSADSATTVPATGGASDSAAPMCAFVTTSQLETLFPGGSVGEPVPNPTLCNIPITSATGSIAYFVMSTSAVAYDERMQGDTANGFTVSQLDGIGEQAYYARGADSGVSNLVFVKGEEIYVVLVEYTNSDLEMPAEPTVQDTLMQIAAAWAASL